MIEVPGADYIYTERDNEKALHDWTKRNYINDGIIGSWNLGNLSFYSFANWYPAILKVVNEHHQRFLYPVLLRDPIKRNYRDIIDKVYRPNNFALIDRVNVGPSIEENEICMSKSVLESMVWQGFVKTFTINKEGILMYRSPLDDAMSCSGPVTNIEMEVIPYDFTSRLLDYFDCTKDNWLSHNFNPMPTKPNPFLDSIDENATQSVKLTRCEIGYQGTMVRIEVSDETQSSYRKYDSAYFLSFTSYGSVTTIFDRQKVAEEKKLEMKMPKSIEEAMMEYRDWSVTIGEKNPPKTEIVVDNSGVDIYNREEKKVEEYDENLLM